ncbi:MAG: guanine permease [Candidatus Tectomicrobia bacterium RIFCSPLOWO2_12_FULL_69_37]|nr:MAG: guanine permease [Candidatus Tectomicrobia bacterium RIFCSPLOWO2_12_FULL_69_37]
MLEWLSRRFELESHGTRIRREVLGGTTTFLTLSYIIFVQPVVLSQAGMDAGAVLMATCIGGALFTVLMGLMTNYPIAMAPAMGHNFFFAFTVCGAAAAGGLGYSWQEALGATAVAGFIFVILSLVGLREKILHCVPHSLRHAIAVGIGLLISLVGMEYGGLVIDRPGTIIGLGVLTAAPVLLTIFGLVVMGALIALRVRGAILIGMLASAAIGLASGLIRFEGLVSLPPSIAPTFLRLDLFGRLMESGFWTAVFIFLFLDMFDSVGTLVGVCERAGFMKGGILPKAREALTVDALATVGGASLGTSTIVGYIESAAGVAAGARTGLANLVTAALFLLSIFFTPLIRTVAGGVGIGPKKVLYPVIAPALIVVGSFMIASLKQIDWDDPTEYLPAFLCAVIMPFTFSITEGIAFGFILYSILKAATGRAGDAHPLVHCLSVLFVLRYAFLAA